MVGEVGDRRETEEEGGPSLSLSAWSSEKGDDDEDGEDEFDILLFFIMWIEENKVHGARCTVRRAGFD